MPQPIKAITFDFWRTLFYARAGSEDRRLARARAIGKHAGVAPEAAEPVFEAVSREFLRVHIAEQRTLSPLDAIPMIEESLAVTLSDEAAHDLAAELADAFLAHPPEAIRDALEAVEAAARRGPVGIVSDTGLTPGSRIRALLEREGFGGHVSAFAFSDEVGVAKPQAAMFHSVADQLGVAPEAILHIGDLEPTDVAGALNVRARAALFAGDNDRYVARTRADHVYAEWRGFIDDLPRLLD